MPCTDQRPLTLRRRSGFLASVVAETTGRGSSDCPWSIRAEPWQRINVTLLDFTAASAAAVAAVDVVDVDPAGSDFGGAGYSEVHPAVAADPTNIAGGGGSAVGGGISSAVHAAPSSDAGGGDSAGAVRVDTILLRTYCQKYAVIRERQQATRETVVCGGDEARREKVVYVSATNELELEMSRYGSLAARKTASSSGTSYFLIHYESKSIRFT